MKITNKRFRVEPETVMGESLHQEFFSLEFIPYFVL